MKNLINAVTMENEKMLQNTIDAIKDTTCYAINNYLTSLRIDQLKKGVIDREAAETIAIKKATKEYEKKAINKVTEIEHIKLAPDFEKLTITIEWKKSKTWGSNPCATITGDTYAKSEYIGGCGYDKESTAISQALSQCPTFMKLLYTKKNEVENIDKKNSDIFGYGSGYGTLPYFEGGVGTSCLYRICDSIGLQFKCISSGKMFDVYEITKK